MGIFHENIKSLLFRTGRSKRWLADASGVSIHTLVNMLHRKQYPRIDTALKIAEALDVSIEELYFNDSIRVPEEKQDNIDHLFPEIKLTVKRLNMMIEKASVAILDGTHTQAPASDIPPSNGVSVSLASPKNSIKVPMLAREVATQEYVDEEETIQIPFIENLAAGNPRAVDYERKTLGITRSQLPKGSSPATLVALKLQGSSMANAGFTDGDIVLVDQDLPAQANDLVMAYVHAFDGCTFKRLKVTYFHGEDGREHKEYFLAWEDGSGKTQTIDPIADSIIGVYVGRVKQ